MLAAEDPDVTAVVKQLQFKHGWNVLLLEAIGQLAQALAHLAIGLDGLAAPLRCEHVEDNLTALLLRDVRRR